MRAAEWSGPRALRLVERPEPRAGEGQAIVAVSRAGICGSDLHSYASGFAVRPGQVLGHEFAGTVVEAPEVPGLEAGMRVTVRPLIPCGRCEACWAGELQLCERGLSESIGYGSDGAFAERVLVPRAEVGVTVFPLPDSVDERAGALVEPLAVGLHAVRRGRPAAGDDVLVLGAGTIGLAVTAFLRREEVGRVVVVDPSPLRREAAARVGADLCLDPAAAEPGDASADLVFECAGASMTPATAIRAVRPGGTVVFSALFGRRIEISPDRLTAKEAALIGAFGYRDEFADVVAALASGEVDAERFISHELPLDRIEEAFRLQADPSTSLKVLVRP